MSEFASGGGDQESIRFGFSHNPHDEKYRTGGSSGGSAEAVGNGTVDVALGSDTGGSIRAPAAFCGIVGVKPTRGLISHDGFVQYAKTLDTIGTLSKTLKPAARILEVMAGTDPNDDLTESAKTGDYTQAVVQGHQSTNFDITIGLPKPIHGHAPDLDTVTERALDEFESDGVNIIEVQIPNFEYALPSWLAIGKTEMGAYFQANATNYWRMHGRREQLSEAIHRAFSNRTQDIGNHVLRDILYAEWMQGDQCNKYYELAQQGRRIVTKGIDEIFNEVDVLAMTTLPIVAPKIGEPYLEEDEYFEVAMHTAPFNLSGHPAITIPVDTYEGLPVGMQLVAPHFNEPLLFELGGKWEAVKGT
jgi:Asp-tRNA(Asn)/Glu-tRNA(Gln) amidotransferase A subunit family amidase